MGEGRDARRSSSDRGGALVRSRAGSWPRAPTGGGGARRLRRLLEPLVRVVQGGPRAAEAEPVAQSGPAHLLAPNSLGAGPFCKVRVTRRGLWRLHGARQPWPGLSVQGSR